MFLESITQPTLSFTNITGITTTTLNLINNIRPVKNRNLILEWKTFKKFK